MKELDILGIHLKDYDLHEGIQVASEYLMGGSLNTIIYLSKECLISAGETAKQKEWLEQMDMAVPGKTDLLAAVGIDDENRILEVERDAFFDEFIKQIQQTKKTVFLLADNENKLERLWEKVLCCVEKQEDNVPDEEEKQIIAGAYLLDGLDDTPEAVINEINDVAPGVVVSCLPFAIQLRYMYEYQKMVNADVWLGLLDSRIVQEPEHSVLEKVKEQYRKRLFRRKVTEYNQENAEEYMKNEE